MAKRCYGCMKLKEKSPVCEHCGYNENVPNYSHQLPIGTVLRDQYVVGKVLGQGGFGITYIGWDESLETAVAIKEYYPNSIVTRDCSISLSVSCAGEGATDLFRHNKERFLREARTLARLHDVPGIVRVHNLFKENDTAYMVMEYVDGIDLKRFIRMQGRTLTPEETLAVMSPIMQALSVVHAAGLVHRDISPDNIMIQPNGSAKLLDFGAVREVNDAQLEKNLSQSTESILKHGYAPIEQYQRRGNLGPWTDVYALCATIYYCLTQNTPPDAPERMIEFVEVEWNKIPGLTEKQIEVFAHGMAILPRDRFISIDQLREALFSKTLETKSKSISEPQQEPVSEQISEQTVESMVVPEQKTVISQIPQEPEHQERSQSTVQEIPKKQKEIFSSASKASLKVKQEQPKTPRREKSVREKNQEDAKQKSVPVSKAEGDDRMYAAPPRGRGILISALLVIALVLTVLLLIPKDSEKQIAVKETITATETAPPDAKDWHDNVLMANPHTKFSDIEKSDIVSITFLDTTEDVPIDNWDVSVDQNGTVLAWAEKNGSLYDLYIAANGGINGKYPIFTDYSSLEAIHFNNCFHTEESETMSKAFSGCTNLTSLDLSSWDTSNAKNISYMFFGCSSLTNVNLDDWNTSNVINMQSIFQNCSSLTTLDLNHLNISNVMNMRNIFYGCSNLSSLVISNWDASSVSYMDSMFKDCSSLTFLDISNWKFDGGSTMSCMFENCSSLVSLKLFQSSSVNYIDGMACMFRNCSSLIALDISNWNTSRTRDMHSMFENCTSLQTLNLSNWDFSEVNDMRNMFKGCSNLSTLEIDNWDSINNSIWDVKTDNMFDGCYNLPQQYKKIQ